MVATMRKEEVSMENLMVVAKKIVIVRVTGRDCDPAGLMKK